MLTILLVASLSLAQSPAQPPAPPSTQPTPSPSTVPAAPATIADAAFLAGDWSASKPSARGGTELTQEVWSAPAGNNMMGMFRWVNPGGKAIVFELLTITEENLTLFLRLRHQSAAGIAWEEKDKPATFTLAERTATTLHFVDTNNTCDLSACIYECPTPDALTITVKFDEPSRAGLVFNLTRAAAR